MKTTINQITLKRLLQVFCCLLFAVYTTNIYCNTPKTTYSVKNGLSNSTVKAIYQDERGYIWIGTRNGLNRFDGYEFKKFYHTPTSEVLQPNDIVSITQLQDGLFWIGTFSGVTLFDPVREKYININDKFTGTEFPNTVVVGLCEDKAGNIWVATKQGLYLFSDNTCTYIEMFKGSYINAMSWGSDDVLLLDILGVGVIEFNIYTRRSARLSELPNERALFFKIFRDSQGMSWLGGSLRDFYRFFPEKKTIEKVGYKLAKDISLDDNYIHDMIEYNDSTLLFATDKGPVLFNKKQSLFYLEPNLEVSDRLMCVYKDQQESVWMGTFSQGVVFYNPKLYIFKYYDLSEINPSGSNTQVIGSLVESQGNLWIGHSRGLGIMNLKNKNIIRPINTPLGTSGSSNSELYYVYQKSEYELILYFLNRGAFLLNTKTREISRIWKEIPSESQIRAIAEDTKKRLWVAEVDLSYFDMNEKRVNYNLSTNQDSAALFMLRLTQGMLRYGQDMILGIRTNGVWRFKYQAGQSQEYFEGERLPFKELNDKNISVLYEDKEGNVWIGTYDSGIYKCNLEKDSIVHYNTGNGLVHNSICGVIEERRTGDVWVSAINGLSQIKKNGAILNYTQKNGFPLDEVSGKSIIQASDGHIYIGGSNGLAEIDPYEYQHVTTTSTIVRLSLLESLNSKPVFEHVLINDFTHTEKVNLSYDNTSIRIKFSALDYIFPEGYKYAYQLDGLDKSWNHIENNEVIYSNIPEGSYVFRIKACNNEGVWSDVETTIPIYVYPPIWLAWWAKLLYGVFILSFLTILTRYVYEKKTAKYKRQIERIEKENLEKNHQMRIEFFTNFSHELRTPLTLIISPAEDILDSGTLPSQLKFPMQQIQKNANRLLLLVNQLMDFRKLEHGSMQLRLSQVNIAIFISEQIDSFSKLLDKHQIIVSYSNDYYGSDLWVDVDLMEKVMLNLLSNAIKHSSKDDKIHISSRAEKNKITISVKDNGDGISVANLSKIFDPFFQVEQGVKKAISGSGIGLNLVQYAVRLHGGNIRVQSEPGQGAEFLVELLLGREHFKDVDVVYVCQADSRPGLEIERRSINPLEEEPKKEYREAKEETHDNNLRLLIAEDDEDMRQYIVSKLSETYTIIEAGDGKTALELATEKFPDLIISDVMMPVIDGVELCRSIKNNMLLAHIPIILLTAKSLEEHIKEGYQALADDYILKPFNIRILRAKVESLIKNREKLKKIFSQKLEAVEVLVAELVQEDPFLNSLVELIKKQVHNSDLSINDLYEELGMSRSQFFRKIKTISDLSPNKLILNIRMKMAAEKLREGILTISEVAYDVGFSDPAYFSRVFKSTYDQTPTEYIKKMGR